MAVTKAEILENLADVPLPDGGTLGDRDLIRAVSIDGGAIQFVIEAPSAEAAQAYDTARAEAERRVRAMKGVDKVSVALTAHSGQGSKPRQAPAGDPPSLKIGGHPTEQAGPADVPGVDRIIAVGSGKGGVGKSTVAANLAVALAREGRRVGLLDADFYGPSQTRMMGVSKRPGSPDGKVIEPLQAHGVTMMSIGLMVEPDKAVVWRGPMLMGALQQMLTQVMWGELDALLIDMPPGTGDVQLTLCQKFRLTGSLIVSTPQDVALMDARRALEMFQRLKAPVSGLIENMSTYVCPQCGHEAHIFGHGGVEAEAAKLGVPYLGALPLNLDVRLAGDAGTPVAAGDTPLAEPYRAMARRMVADGTA